LARAKVRLNRRVMKAYLLKESFGRLWTYTHEGGALRYLNGWVGQLQWQRLEPPAVESVKTGGESRPKSSSCAKPRRMLVFYRFLPRARKRTDPHRRRQRINLAPRTSRATDGSMPVAVRTTAIMTVHL